jgi:hypothetical protein
MYKSHCYSNNIDAYCVIILVNISKWEIWSWHPLSILKKRFGNKFYDMNIIRTLEEFLKVDFFYWDEIWNCYKLSALVVVRALIMNKHLIRVWENDDSLGGPEAPHQTL